MGDFLPTTRKEIDRLGWEQPDIILVSGDTYIDSPYIGVAVIGRVLSAAGYKTAIIAQPDVETADDIGRLGEPKLFWGVTGGSVDSMVANYTALKKHRKSDDFTPGTVNNKRPDRAVIVYTNLIKRFFKKTKPIVIGGVEASMRRVVHYDFFSNSLKRSILFDSKADYLIYGMGEEAVVGLAQKLSDGKVGADVKGLCYISSEKNVDTLKEKVADKGVRFLPSFESCQKNKSDFSKMFHLFYKNNSPQNGKILIQKHGDRYLVHNAPQPYLMGKKLDDVYDLDFQFEVHPYYKKIGEVRALSTISNSITSHRGCYGECNFCSISVHQGLTIRSRSENSILKEVVKFSKKKGFKGTIRDVGGPTANMYGYECSKKMKHGPCPHKRCLSHEVCNTLPVDHKKYISLLEKIRKLPGIKNVFISSGLRYDLILDDKKNGKNFMMNLLKYHTSGQLKIAPEHSDDRVLHAMGKPSVIVLKSFIELFKKYNNKLKKKLFLTYYLIAAHPGCNLEQMKSLKEFTTTNLKINPEQVQIFTPLPSTWSALMYYTGVNPFSDKKIFVERDSRKRANQKDMLTKKWW